MKSTHSCSEYVVVDADNRGIAVLGYRAIPDYQVLPAGHTATL